MNSVVRLVRLIDELSRIFEIRVHDVVVGDLSWFNAIDEVKNLSIVSRIYCFSAKATMGDCWNCPNLLQIITVYRVF